MGREVEKGGRIQLLVLDGRTFGSCTVGWVLRAVNTVARREKSKLKPLRDEFGIREVRSWWALLRLWKSLANSLRGGGRLAVLRFGRGPLSCHLSCGGIVDTKLFSFSLSNSRASGAADGRVRLRCLLFRLQLMNHKISIGDRIASNTIGTTIIAVNALLDRPALLGAGELSTDWVCVAIKVLGGRVIVELEVVGGGKGAESVRMADSAES